MLKRSYVINVQISPDEEDWALGIIDEEVKIYREKDKVIMSFRVYMASYSIESYVKNLCRQLDKNCISVFDVTSQTGMVVHNLNYKGKRCKWDKNSFLWDI